MNSQGKSYQYSYMIIYKYDHEFRISHLVDLVGLVYKYFTKKVVIFLIEQRLKKKNRRACSTNLETFYRVLSLLVETNGLLLPPFEMITSSNKKLLWSAKGACNGCSLSQIQMTQVTSQYHIS